ncbi:hypothetical protein RyT2_18130 [Pseudolactococcus yaeyamensis]
MTKTKQLMKNSYQILNSLTPDNGQFFYDLMQYLRTKAFLKNALSLELKINEIANDLKKADLEGISAETFFGNQPKETAQDILKSLPNDKISHLFKTHFLLLISFFGVMPFAFSAYTDEINGIEHHYISFLAILLMASYSILFMFITSALISRGVFNQKMRKTTPYLIWMTMMITYMIPMFLHLLHLDIWRYEIPAYWQPTAITITMIAAVLYLIQQFPLAEMWKMRKKF